MPKATWGTGDNALTAGDIDGAERSQQYAVYDGEIPPNGLYRFVLKNAKKGKSSNDNPQLRLIWELDGEWKPKHKKYEGCPLFDYMPVMKSTAFRVAAFCDAVGASSKDFHSGMIVDEDGIVTKLGRLGDPTGILAYINVKKRPATEKYSEKLELNGTGYLSLEDAPDDDEAEGSGEEPEADGEADGEEPPF